MIISLQILPQVEASERRRRRPNKGKKCPTVEQIKAKMGEGMEGGLSLSFCVFFVFLFVFVFVVFVFILLFVLVFFVVVVFVLFLCVCSQSYVG